VSSGVRECYSLEVRGKKVLLDFLYLGKPCPKSKFLFPSLAPSRSMASGCSLDLSAFPFGLSLASGVGRS